MMACWSHHKKIRPCCVRRWIRRVSRRARACVCARVCRRTSETCGSSLLSEPPSRLNRPLSGERRAEAGVRRAAPRGRFVRSPLCAVDKADGQVIAQVPLPCSPVFDGMIAADGKLFISLADGCVMAMEGK